MARPREATDEVLLRVTREFLLEQGTDTTLDAISEALGLPGTELVRRFGSCEALIAAALRPPPADWIDRLDDGPDARPIELQLRDLTAAAVAYFDQTLPLQALIDSSEHPLLEEEGEPSLPTPLRAQRAMATWFSAAIERGQLETADPMHAAIVFLGTLTFASMNRQWAQAPPDGAPTAGEIDAILQKFRDSL